MSHQINKRVYLLIALLALSLIAIGCGGDDEEQPSSLSKAQYVKQADEICAATEKRQRKLINQYGRENKNAGTGKRETEELISFAALPPMERMAKELSELPSPEKGAAEAQAYVQAFEKGVEVTAKEPSAILAEPGAFSKAEELAKEFGFKTCGGA